MPKVEIDTPGVTIRVEATESSAKELGDLALQLYRDTNDIDSKKSLGPATGFTAERRWTHDTGQERRGAIYPVTAKEGDAA